MHRNAVQVRQRCRCFRERVALLLHIRWDGIGPLSGEPGSTDSTLVPKTRAEVDYILTILERQAKNSIFVEFEGDGKDLR